MCDPLNEILDFELDYGRMMDHIWLSGAAGLLHPELAIGLHDFDHFDSDELPWSWAWDHVDDA